MTDPTDAASRRLRSRSRSRLHALTGEPAASPAGEVIGTVWATGQTDLGAQLRQRGYPSDALRTDPAAMPPAIAAHAIAAFTSPGDLVLDPDCGAGTTLVEALHAGCHTIGLAGTHRVWQQARANVSAAKLAGAPVDGMVLILGRRPNTLATAHAAGFTGRIDLILTTLRIPARSRGARTVDAALSRLRVLLADSRALLHPDGHVVVTTVPYRDPDQPTELLDVPGQIMEVASAVGLVPLARCVALTGALHRDHVRPWHRRPGRPAAHRGGASRSHPATVPAHQTVLVFAVAPTARLRQPQPPTLPSQPTANRFAAIDDDRGRRHRQFMNPKQSRRLVAA
jgi:hypothetical protein